MNSRKEKTLKVLEALIEDAERRKNATLEKGAPVWEGFETWRVACMDIIQIIYDANSYNHQSFTEIRFAPPQTAGLPSDKSQSIITFTVGLTIAIERLKAFQIAVNVWMLEENSSITPIIFVSHAQKAILPLQKVNDFLLVLGAVPIVLEKLPSYNLSPDQKIKHYMKECNVGLAILTADDELATGEKQSRQTVAYEIGLMQESTNINGRIIFIKENDVKPPSGYGEKIWTPFTNTDFEEVYISIIRELKGWQFSF